MTPWASLPAMRAMKLRCDSMTPLGWPVEPEVYMMKARSSAPGMYLSSVTLDSRPDSSKPSQVVKLAMHAFGSAATSLGDGKDFVSPPTVLSGTKHLPMRTTCKSDVQWESTGSSSASYWPQSMKSTEHSVSFKPCFMASCPRVVYTVVIGMPHWNAACADICHSAEVSARMPATQVFSCTFAAMDSNSRSPLAAACTSLQTSPKHFHS
mmetsp:Transcript_52641/g.145939  ORF Transcript_52641/g.145939 Transcript_52641/m.145939 type:complete len:209 (+) Transcript_52641:1339-1965(+)